MRVFGAFDRSVRGIGFRLVLRLTVGIAVLVAGASAAEARRVALVIGIEKYTHVAPLTNPEKDARRIAAALGKVGFEVTLLVKPTEVTRAGLVGALKIFRDKAEGSEAAVIYYAGHGVEVEGRNWTLPIDVEADRPADLQDNAIPTKRLMEAVGGAQEMRLVVMDACRDNPFAMASGWSQGGRSIGTRGLARETGSDIGSVLLMAAQPGQKASDGAGQANSPFAALLAQSIETPGLRISSLPTQLLRGMRALNVDQAPDLQGIFANADWQFSGGSATAGPNQVVAVAPAPVRLAMPAPPLNPISRPSAAPVAMFGLTLQQGDEPGLAVSAIAANSPYAGKMQRGDVITRVNGAQPPAPGALFDLIRREGTAEVLLNRNGRSIFLTMNLPQPQGEE